MPNVLISPWPIRHQPGPFRTLLEAAGCTPIDLPAGDDLTAAELLAVLPTADAVIAGGETYSAEVLSRAPRLKVIARAGVGYDAIDLAAATARGIAVTIVPGTNHDSVAEHAFALLLAVTRKIALNDRNLRAGKWERMLLAPLRGKTLGLVGLGRIGKAMVARARAFGMSIVAYDPVADPEFDASHGIRRLELHGLLAEADVVSLHLPLNTATRDLFNRALFSRMKPGSFLINTSRGGLVVEPDLRDALESGHLAGAGLDVFQREPIAADNPLLPLPNVVLSPHLAGIDTKAMADMAEKAAWCITEIIRGGWPGECVVNQEVRGQLRR